MAAPYNPPRKNEDFAVDVGLDDINTAGRLKSSPTLAAGDVKVRLDAGAFANVTTLPTATGKAVQLLLSSAEMNADIVTVVFSDQTDPPEWADLLFSIPTVA
jgi:hypothetical protein